MGLPARAGLGDSNQKSRVSVSARGSYLRGAECTQAPQTADHRTVGEVSRNVGLSVTLQLLSRVCACMKGWHQFRDAADPFAKQNGCRGCTTTE